MEHGSPFILVEIQNMLKCRYLILNESCVIERIKCKPDTKKCIGKAQILDVRFIYSMKH